MGCVAGVPIVKGPDWFWPVGQLAGPEDLGEEPAHKIASEEFCLLLKALGLSGI